MEVSTVCSLFLPPPPPLLNSPSLPHFWSSASSVSMALKSAFPTPTMMMDMGREEAAMMALFVSSMSDMTPSVSINSTKYCWGRGERNNNVVQVNLHHANQLAKHYT